MKFILIVIISLSSFWLIGQDAGMWDKSKAIIIEGDKIPEDRFIDMYLSNGTQILKNGFGIYYKFFKQDSLVYRVKDSVPNGPYQRFRLTDKKYRLIETGQFKNWKPFGTFVLIDSVERYKLTTSYLSDKKIEDYSFWNEQLKTTELSHFVNGKIEGRLQLFDENGVLTKEIDHKNGTRFGRYKEYYQNGKIKTEGKYTQVDTTSIVESFDEIGRSVARPAIYKVPKQTGKWVYYDETGKIIRTETFKVKKRGR